MKNRWLLVVGALVILVVAVGARYWFGGEQALYPPIYTADGYVGTDQASFQVGDVTYGFQSSVDWTDQTGAQHPGGWPACLPRVSEVKAVRFAANVLWHDSWGTAQVTWVDCRNP